MSDTHQESTAREAVIWLVAIVLLAIAGVGVVSASTHHRSGAGNAVAETPR